MVRDRRRRRRLHRGALRGRGNPRCQLRAASHSGAAAGFRRERYLRDRDLPQETAQTRALHFAKGCYLGQEIVERIRSRGQVHRTFTAFTLHGNAPPAGTELLADGKPAGLLTTVAAADIDGERLALGFVRREAVERGSRLDYPGGIAEPRNRPPAS